MSDRRYYFAVFGDPHPPNKDLVESGIYHPDPSRAPFDARPGDVLVLYCTGAYLGHEKQVPGVGIVLGVDDALISYRYVPFSGPVRKPQIDKGLTPEDRQKFGRIRFSTFWLFEISRESFEQVLGSERTRRLELARAS